MSTTPTRDRALLLAITALAALLRFPGLGAQNLWCDEIYSLDLAALPVARIFTFQDGHPPLFHLLEKAACMILATDLCGRLLSAAIGVATVPLLFIAGRRLFDRRVGLCVAFLLAASPFHIWYSREGRMYALVVFWAALSSYYLPDVSGRRSRGVVAFVAATLGGLMSHYAYVAVAAGQLGFVALCGVDPLRQRRAAVFFVIVALTAAAVTLLAPALHELALGPVGPTRAADLLAAPYALFTLLAGFGVGPSVRALQESRGLASLTPFWPEISVATAIIAFALVVGTRDAFRRPPWGAYLLVAAVVPILIVATMSFSTGLAFNPRYVIGTLPAWLLLISLGITSSTRRMAAAILVGLIAVSALSQFRDHTDPAYQREQIREAARYIATHAAASDRIFFGPLYVGETVAHYLPPGRTISRFPVKKIIRDDQVDEALAEITPSDSSVWVLRTREWSDDPDGRLERALLARVTKVGLREFAGVKVYRLDP